MLTLMRHNPELLYALVLTAGFWIIAWLTILSTLRNIEKIVFELLKKKKEEQ